MKLSTVLAAGLFCFMGLTAQAFEGFVSLKTGRQVYVKTEMVDSARPTILLVNGLTYNLNDWDAFSHALSRYKFNIVRFDMAGQGKVLAKFGPVQLPIDYKDQVEDMQGLIESLHLNNVTSLGLSYGGAIAVAHAARYAEHIARVIAMAPYTEALRQQDRAVQQQIFATRLMFPFNPASDEELYDYFLKQTVYLTYPFAEPSILNQANKLDATFQMVQGIRKLKLGTLVANLSVPTHLVQAESDQYLDADALEEFWASVPPQVKISRATIGQSEHKIPEAQPEAAAAWLNAILANHELIKNGNAFFVDSKTKVAIGDAGTIVLH